MASQVAVALCVVLGLVSHQVSAQWWGGAAPQNAGMGQAASPALAWGGRQQQSQQFLTCIALNNMNDEMRITFSQNQRNNDPWGAMWGNRFAQGGGSIRLSARITSGQTSNLQGEFQLAITEFSRTEEMCLSRAVGDILTDQTPVWWGQQSTPKGIIGSPIMIGQGQTATISETLPNLDFSEIVGRGTVLCHRSNIQGTTCLDPIPLCCKNGYDSQPATTPFTQQAQFMQQGGMAMPAPGFGNAAFGNPMDQGMGAGFNQGMGQVGQPMAGGMNPGQPMVGGQPGFGGQPAFGGQPGLGMEQAGQPALGGMPFKK